MAMDVNDLLAMVAAWGPCTDDPCLADMIDEGIADMSDLLYVLASWSACIAC
jgi:hypothetical protein